MKSFRLHFLYFVLLSFCFVQASAQSETVKNQLSSADGYFYGEKYAEAKSIYLRHLQDLSPIHQYRLGICYYSEGAKDPQGYIDGMKWLLQSAERGHTEAMNSIAYFYQIGFGVKKDSVVELSWTKKSADFGNPDALLAMAYYFQTGLRGLPIDGQKAKELYLKAIDRNSNKAGYYLALLEKQNGNLTNTFHYMEKSAKQGFAPAQLELGKMYEEGTTNVNKDLDEAYRWYNKIRNSPENRSAFADAALRMRAMGLLEPSTDLSTVKPKLLKLATRANESFYDVKGKLIEPANKSQFDNLGSSKNEYYASLIDLGFKNVYIRRNNFNQVQKDKTVKNVDQYIYHAEIIHSSNKENTYRVYKKWADLLKSIFSDWNIADEDKPQFQDGTLTFWKDNSNGKRTRMVLKTCCSSKIVEFEIINL